MLNMISINLDSITTQEAFIINKAPIDGKEMKLTLSRKCTPTNDAPNMLYYKCFRMFVPLLLPSWRPPDLHLI